MSETCIVCLGDLGESANELLNPAVPNSVQSNDDQEHLRESISKSLSHSEESEYGLIAHLLPCGHNLHNECLKPWVERANSCPICRQSFNLVELRVKIGGTCEV